MAEFIKDDDKLVWCLEPWDGTQESKRSTMRLEEDCRDCRSEGQMCAVHRAQALPKTNNGRHRAIVQAKIAAEGAIIRKPAVPREIKDAAWLVNTMLRHIAEGKLGFAAREADDLLTLHNRGQLLPAIDTAKLCQAIIDHES
jgi:hypothetical protein